jgi:hypothetical protein
VEEASNRGKICDLYKELMDDETKLHEYLRLSQYAFSILLGKVQNDLQKRDTRWRKAVTSTERLAVCFRYENKDYLLESNIYFEKLQLIICKCITIYLFLKVVIN